MGTIDGGLLDVAMKQAVQAMRGRSWVPVAIGVLMGVSRSIDNGVFSDVVLRSVFNMAKDPRILLVPVLAAKIGGKVGLAGSTLSIGRAQKAAEALKGAQAVFATIGEIVGLAVGAEEGGIISELFDGENFFAGNGDMRHLAGPFLMKFSSQDMLNLVPLREGGSFQLGALTIQLSAKYPAESPIPVDRESAPVIDLPRKPE